MIALSCDEVEAHNGWIGDIKAYNGLTEFAYPIIADPSREIAMKYSMLDPVAKDNAGMPLTCRCVILKDSEINPKNKLNTNSKSIQSLIHIIFLQTSELCLWLVLIRSWNCPSCILLQLAGTLTRSSAPLTASSWPPGGRWPPPLTGGREARLLWPQVSSQRMLQASSPRGSRSMSFHLERYNFFFFWKISLLNCINFRATLEQLPSQNNKKICEIIFIF